MLSNFSISNQAGKVYFYSVFAVIAFAVGIVAYLQIAGKHKGSNLDSLTHATSLHTNPRTFPIFNLIDHNGNKFSNNELKDTWNFIFFGFTHCPDVCPLTLSTLDQATSTITSNNPVDVKTIFISVDPNRDTPQVIEKYVKHFNNRMVGLTGSDEQLKLLTQSLGVVYTSPESGKNKHYLIDHSAHIFLVAPNGNLVALFSTPHKHQTIVDDFIILNNYYNNLHGS